MSFIFVSFFYGDGDKNSPDSERIPNSKETNRVAIYFPRRPKEKSMIYETEELSWRILSLMVKDPKRLHFLRDLNCNYNPKKPRVRRAWQYRSVKKKGVKVSRGTNGFKKYRDVAKSISFDNSLANNTLSRLVNA